MSRALKRPAGGAARASIKNLNKFDSVEFDENSRRIRIDFTQNPRVIANDSFNRVC
jgi:hypothetical protein